VELPRWQRIAPFPSISESLCRLYVWEAATLGGQVITRHIRAVLALKKNAGLSFFYSYGSAVPARWRQFREVFSANVRSDAHEELAVSAAIDTLEMFCRWMKGNERFTTPGALG
jgi:heme oxygenase